MLLFLKNQIMTSASLVTKLQRKLMISPPVEEDPRLLNNRQKAIVLIGIALCAGTPGFSSTIYFPGKNDDVCCISHMYLSFS